MGPPGPPGLDGVLQASSVPCPRSDVSFDDVAVCKQAGHGPAGHVRVDSSGRAAGQHVASWARGEPGDEAPSVGSGHETRCWGPCGTGSRLRPGPPSSRGHGDSAEVCGDVTGAAGRCRGRGRPGRADAWDRRPRWLRPGAPAPAIAGTETGLSGSQWGLVTPDEKSVSGLCPHSAPELPKRLLLCE